MSSILFRKEALYQALLEQEALDSSCLDFINTLFDSPTPVFTNAKALADYFEGLEEPAYNYHVARIVGAMSKTSIAVQQLLLSYCAEAYWQLGKVLQEELLRLRQASVENRHDEQK